MVALFYLLCAFALLGSVDIGYFHLYRFRLYRVSSSRGEQITHLLRTLLFLAALIWVMDVEAHGLFSVILPAILAVDFVNSMLDVLLEPASRRPLGGLPPLEYAVHMLTMFVSGAIMAIAVVECLASLDGPTSLRWHPLDVPPASRAMGWQIAVVTTGLCVYEGLGFLASVAKGRAPRSP